MKNTIRYAKVGLLVLGINFFLATGHPGGVGPPSVNLGPPNISETTRARTLKLKMQLDIPKYSYWV